MAMQPLAFSFKACKPAAPLHVHRPEDARCSVLCQATRKVALVRRRAKLAPGQRRRKKYQDEGRPVPAVPGTPPFEGTVMAAINAANGPVQLLSIMAQHGGFLPVQHVGLALSRLAGFATGSSLTSKQVEAVKHCAALCTRALKPSIAEASPLDLARSVYSLYRLKHLEPELAAAGVDRSLAVMHTFMPDALAGLAAAVGASGHQPPGAWLDRLCLETYIRMPRLNAQDLANIMFGLARMGHVPSAVWLERAQRQLRETVQVLGANPPALVKFAWALATMQARPTFNWMLFLTSELRRRIDLFTARELATLAWVCARLGHRPDPLFLEAWYRAATRRMPTFAAPTLLLAMHSAALWGAVPGSNSGGGVGPQVARDMPPPPGKFLAVLLPRTQGMLPELQGPQLVQLLWSLVSLQVRPDEGWMEVFVSAAEASVSQLRAGDLADCVWAFAQLRYQPSEPWERDAVAQVDAQLADFTPQQLGVLLWGWRSVQLPVPKRWDDVFVAAGQAVWSQEQMRDLSALLGMLAAEQNSDAARARSGW